MSEEEIVEEINKLLIFDRNWARKVIELDDLRLSHDTGFQHKKILVLMDVADELERGFDPDDDLGPTFDREDQAFANEIFKYFTDQLAKVDD